MTSFDLWFDYLVPALVTALLCRAVWVAIAVETSARWLLNPQREQDPERQDAPWLVLVLPMLREQTVAAEAINAFASLDSPGAHVAVVVVTTERENSQRARMRARLPQVAERPSLSPRHLRGLIPVARAAEVAQEVGSLPPAERLATLTKRFDAEPTTDQVVANVVRQSSRGLRLVHLHQPDTGGRKAGQLNFAVDQLPEVLGPLGWREERHRADTYVVVYDADAIPDRRTVHAFARAARKYRLHTGTAPALIQQQRLPILTRRPFPSGAPGLLLTEEWLYQVRRSLGIELARIRLHERMATSRIPGPLRTLLRPMVYGVGCGMAVHLPALRALGGFPEPMEDLGTGHRLSLLGGGITATSAAVLDEPYTEPSGLTNLHALAFSASARPDRHARVVAHLPTSLSAGARTSLILREWADEVAWLLGAPLVAAAIGSAWWSGPLWSAIAGLGVLLHGPVVTVRLLHLIPRLHAAVQPPSPYNTARMRLSRGRMITWVLVSPVQPFVRLAGPWRLIFRHMTGRRVTFGKTER